MSTGSIGVQSTKLRSFFWGTINLSRFAPRSNLILKSFSVRSTSIAIRAHRRSKPAFKSGMARRTPAAAKGTPLTLSKEVTRMEMSPPGNPRVFLRGHAGPQIRDPGPRSASTTPPANRAM